MPDVQEVFRMATQKVRPDPGALERQHRNQRWRSVKRKAGVYALVAGIIAAGLVVGIGVLRDGQGRVATPPDEQERPTTTVEGLAPTVERLRGIWYEEPGVGATGHDYLLFWFGPNGEFTWGGAVTNDSWVTGTYEVTGHTITVTATGGFCGDGFTFSWEAAIGEDGRLVAIHGGSDMEPPTAMGDCTLPIGEPFDMARVSPTSDAASDIRPGFFAGGAITAETTALDLRGMWLVQETGHLLLLQFSGSYALDDAGALASDPFDVGSIEIGRGTLTFTSGSGARGCTEGDVMVWRNVRVDEGRLRATVGEDGCGHGLPDDITLLYLDLDTPA